MEYIRHLPTHLRAVCPFDARHERNSSMFYFSASNALTYICFLFVNGAHPICMYSLSRPVNGKERERGESRDDMQRRDEFSKDYENGNEKVK